MKSLEPRGQVQRMSLAKHGISTCFGVVSCLLLALSNFGCATVHGEKYTYKNLPPNYIAGVRENPQTIDLTRLASTSKQSDVLDRGDVVEIAIAAGLNEKDTVKFPVRIEEDGNANIPQIGRIMLAGLKMEAAEAAIIYECVDRGLYRAPSVTLTMKSQRTNRIMVAGAVKKPSVYDLPRGQSDLLTAISRAEGLDNSAGTQVVIRNPGLRGNGSQQRIAGKHRQVSNLSGTVSTSKWLRCRIRSKWISSRPQRPVRTAINWKTERSCMWKNGTLSRCTFWVW